MKYVHQDRYVAEVEIELQEDAGDWSPSISVEDAKRLDEVRSALSRDDLESASRHGCIYEMRPVANH